MGIDNKFGKEKSILRTIPKKEHTLEICKEAIINNPEDIKYASKKCLDKDICLYAVKVNPELFTNVPDKLKNQEMCQYVIEHNPLFLKYVPEKFMTTLLLSTALSLDERAIKYINKEMYSLVFNENTPVDIIKKVVDYDNHMLKYMPNNNDVIELCIKYMEYDLYNAKYIPQAIRGDKEIVNYQLSRKILKIRQKKYDKNENKFKIVFKVIYGHSYNLFLLSNQIEGYYDELKVFDSFDKFYDYLDGDLSNADLTDYDFSGIDINKYNTEGAAISSYILNKFGKYDNTYYSEFVNNVKENTNTNDNGVTELDDIHINVVSNELIDNTIEKSIFFYISDIHLMHRVYKKFPEQATKEEMFSYIKYLARNLAESVAYKPYNSYLLIAGDTSSRYDFSIIFYRELAEYWNPNKIIAVLGNHELCDPWISKEENINLYRKMFSKLNIIFLQNDLIYIGIRKHGIIYEDEFLNMPDSKLRDKLYDCYCIILGGIGFSGLNEKYNASNLKYGKSFEECSKEEAIIIDKSESEKFNTIYNKLLDLFYNKKIVVLSHTEKSNWNSEKYNPNWIYVNGHNHRNFFISDSEKTIYADNQIGYKGEKVSLKHFSLDNSTDIFFDYNDGIYNITKEQYIEFNRYKMISVSFSKKCDDIYMIKKNGNYMFFSYCKYLEKSWFKTLYILNGGKLLKTKNGNKDDLEYYYETLDKYTKNIHLLLDKYTLLQRKISGFVKRLGGSGKIHGCIIDVEKPLMFNDFSYCHLYVNPANGNIIPYYAEDVRSRKVYKSFELLLKDNHMCKLIEENLKKYIGIYGEKDFELQLLNKSDITHEKDFIYDKGSYIYKISRIIKSLQYCTDKNIVRIWNDDILRHDFINSIINTKNIEDMVVENLIIEQIDNK